MKNILITGVSRGLGLKIVEFALKAGYRVFGISKSLSDEFNLLMKNNQDKLFWKSLDLRDIKQNFKDSIFDNFIGNRPLHGVIFNAAIAYDDLLTNLDVKKLEEMYRINVFTNMILCKYAIRNMILYKIKGSLIFISSISAHTGFKGLSLYASTKGALESFSKNVSREWGELGIRSNCIVAGFMETDMSQGLTETQKMRIFNRASLKSPTNIESVAHTALFLLDDGSFSITGQNIFVDSGSI